LTGDELTFSEKLSWQLQTSVIRTWWFLIAFTAVTGLCIYLGIVTANPSYATNWNYLASYLAIFVEAIVGRAMFSQTRRDAQIIRELRRVLQEVKAIAQSEAKHQEADLEVSIDVNQKLGQVIEMLADEFDVDPYDVEPWYGEYNEPSN
jgi:hypothetical protein